MFAKTDPSAPRSRGISAFVVEADRPGFSVGKLEHKLGIKGSPTGQPIFDDVRIPAANLIGEVDKGMNVALGTLDHSRLGVAAQAVGIAQGAIDHAVAYANERKQFGQPISEFQGMQFKLADMETRTAAARELLYRACAKIDRHEPDAASTPRWPSCSPPTRRCTSPSRPSRCSAATATSTSIRSSATCATPRSRRSTRARTRSSVS